MDVTQDSWSFTPSFGVQVPVEGGEGACYGVHVEVGEKFAGFNFLLSHFNK